MAAPPLATETCHDGPMADPEFLELSLVLPKWQLYALDDLARSRGLSVGQLLRRLIGNMLQEIAAERQQ